MYFDRVVATEGRIEAFFKGELVRLRVRGSDGWVDVPLEASGKVREKVWEQAELPVARKTSEVGKLEPRYESFEEAP